MRPRVFPAEDSLPDLQCGGHPEASMRPRVFPAEDLLVPWCVRYPPSPASMRPRVFPAEDAIFAGFFADVLQCFNEAAGIPRGRRRSRACSAPARFSLQ